MDIHSLDVSVSMPVARVSAIVSFVSCTVASDALFTNATPAPTAAAAPANFATRPQSILLIASPLFATSCVPATSLAVSAMYSTIIEGLAT
jgi:hypothetical protein